MAWRSTRDSTSIREIKAVALIKEKQLTKRYRFIAGAVCPNCRELDRIVIKEREGLSFRHCVSCGFSEEKPINVEGPSPSLKGRLEQPAPNELNAVKLNIINLVEK